MRTYEPSDGHSTGTERNAILSPYLSITPYYTDEMPLPESYEFEIHGVPNDRNIIQALRRLQYHRYAANHWRKSRYGEHCGQRKRHEEIEKLRTLMPGLVVGKKQETSNMEKER